MPKPLSELHSDGTLKMLCKRGLLSVSVLAYFDYYTIYTKYRKDGNTYRSSILLTAIDCKVSEATVKVAVSKVRD